jgi:RND superfamily putative drug exporter
MFYRLGSFSAHKSWLICLVWLIAGCALSAVAPSWDTQTEDDDVRFVPDRFTSVRAYQLLEKAFPDDVFASRVVFAIEREDGTLTSGDFRIVDQLIEAIDQLRQDAPELKIGKTESYHSSLVGWRMVSTDQQCTLVQVSLSTPYLALTTMQVVDRMDAAVKQRLDSLELDCLQVHTTGSAGIGRDLTRVCGDSLDHTTWATIILVVVVLLCVYRAPLLALVPLLTIAISVWVSLKLLAMMTLIPGVHLVNISKIFAIVILYGAGTDYCLFLISRYREELEAGFDVNESIARSVRGVGEALAASAGTVMVGLGLMALAEFAKVRYAGPAIALSLGIALLASLTLTPALLSIAGRFVFWPGKSPKPSFVARLAGTQPESKLGLWDHISTFVARRPVFVWFAAVAILAPLVVLGLRIQPNYRATGELSPETASLQGLSSIQRHFTAGEIGPITVLLTSSHDWSTPLAQRELDRLSRGFAGMEGVAEVRSLVQPVGIPWIQVRPDPKTKNLFNRLLLLVEPALNQWHNEVVEDARGHYVAKIENDGQTQYVTRIDVVLKTDPFDPESVRTLKTIQTWLAIDRANTNILGENLQSECYGITAIGQDLMEVTESDRVRVNGFVLAAILLILIVLVRRVWLAVYLLITVLASYYAALGATSLAGYFWTGEVLTHIDWRVPFFLFTILVAVGEDYNILLMARAIEERKKHGPVEGMRIALGKTGGAITSCGLIMAGTFATLMLAGLNTLMQVGFALAFGVLVDTFIVRPFLVPACAILFWGGEAAQVVEEEEIEPALKRAA